MNRRTLLKVGGGMVFGAGLHFWLKDDGFQSVVNNAKGSTVDAFGDSNPPPIEESLKTPKTRDQILWTVTRPWMRTIARGEGTYVPSKPDMIPYQVIYTYDSFTDYSDHPRRAHRIPGDPRKRVSDAAGAYQFISTTWDKLDEKFPIEWAAGEPAFGPRNQDLGFLHLHADTGAHAQLSDGSRTYGGLSYINYSHFQQAVYCDSREWASFPGYDIGAGSGQHTRRIEELWSWFSWELNKEQGLLAKTIVPAEGHSPDSISSRFGWRKHPKSGLLRFHNGLDWPTVTGTPLLAPEDGYVSKYYLGGGGNTLVFRPKTDPFKVVRFMHLDGYAKGFKEDMWVGQGDVIGYTGNTGTSTTGPHLHAEVWQGVEPGSWSLKNAAPVNPLPYFKLGQYLS